MSKADFFALPVPEMPRKELELPTFGKLTLVKLDTVGQMQCADMARDKITEYQDKPFMVNSRHFMIPESLAKTAAALFAMQAGNEKYSFEELVAAAVTAEDEFNLLTIAANDLNNGGSPDPKDSELPISSSEPQDEALNTTP